jgi:LemA protein
MGLFFTIFFLSLLLVVALYVMASYNSIVKRRNSVDNAFGSMDVMLKKRHELIPALLQTLKGYMEYEKSVLMEITALRKSAENKDLQTEEKWKLENAISDSLEKIRLQIEDYPDLKASENFLQLQQALNDIEAQLSASRRFYNAAITQYNNTIQVFPNLLVAPVFGFYKKNVFSTTAFEREEDVSFRTKTR